MTDSVDRLGKIEKLSALLESASQIVDGLQADPMRRRLLRVFAKAPLEDRATLLGILEREIGFRRATLEEGEALTGYGAHLNRNARLYVRTFVRAPAALQPLDHDEMVFANLRSARLMRMVLAPDIHPRWRAATLEAFRLLEPDEREEVERVTRELLEILLLAAQTEAPAPAAGG